MSYPARPKPPPPPKAPKGPTPATANAQTPRIFGAVPAVAVAAILALIALHPRNVEAEQVGNRFMAQDTGYKASVDRMASLGLFSIEELPQDRGLPSRSRVVFDEAVIDDPEVNEALCADYTPSLWERFREARDSLFSDQEPLTPCRKLIRDYQRATYLTQDMVRASRETWQISGDNIRGIRRNAHLLRESGYDPDSANFRILYKTGTRAGGGAWALVDPVTTEAEPLLSEADSARCETNNVPASFRTYCFEDGVAVLYPRGGSPMQVYYNGRVHNSPGRAGSQKLIALQEGDTLAFARAGATPEKVLQLLERPQALSEIRSGVRVRDPAFAGLASQVDAGLSSSLTSSIDPDLQTVVQQELDETLDGAPRKARSSLRGAILLMDGLNGKIAAGATFPRKPDQLLPRDRQRPNRQIWLKQNQAFEALPVGSTAKVPFATAIASAQPDLMDMTVARSATMRYNPSRYLRSGSFASARSEGSGSVKVLGTGLSNVDFTTAISRSDNFYAVKLVREAWVANRDAPRSADWLYNLHLLSCSAPDDLSDVSGCPMYLWGDTRRADRGLMHRGVVFSFDPETVASKPHQGLFIASLGNGSYNWSLAQLTQSYARLLSGTLVTATLSDRGHEGAPLADQLRGDGYDRAYTFVTKGMRDVITGGGTGKELADLEQKLGPNVFLYAKTGTPTVLYREGVDGRVFVLALVRTSNNQPLSSTRDLSQICSVRFLSINLQYDVSPLKVARRLLEDDARVRDWMTAKCPTNSATKGAT